MGRWNTTSCSNACKNINNLVRVNKCPFQDSTIGAPTAEISRALIWSVYPTAWVESEHEEPPHLITRGICTDVQQVHARYTARNARTLTTCEELGFSMDPDARLGLEEITSAVPHVQW